MISYAKLPLPFNLRAMQQELSALKGEWLAHFNTRHYEGAWTVMALRSAGGSANQIIPDLINSTLYENTELMAHFPSVVALLANISCPIMAVRFLNLQAGAIIKPHRDHELAFEMGEARLHFPVITNPMVAFNIDDACISLHEGDCWYINANLMHSVENRGKKDRIHLVIDCKVNDWFKHTMSQATTIAHKADNNGNDLIHIIRELKLQNTETSNKLAAELEQQLTLFTSTPASN